MSPSSQWSYICRCRIGQKLTERLSYRLAYRAGVTTAISAPMYSGFYGGLGTSFSLGAENRLEPGAVIQETTAFHVAVRHFGAGPSVSTQIAALRQLLLSGASAKEASASSNEHVGVFVDIVKVRRWWF